MFQRLLNALLYRVQWREYRHRYGHCGTGLLWPSEQGGLPTHRHGFAAQSLCIRQRRPDPPLAAMPFDERRTGCVG